MTTFQPTSVLFEVVTGREIPIAKLAYFRGRLTNRIHELVLSEFLRQESENQITKAELARRIGRKPEQVSRWLGAAGNWTIETLSDLMLALGCEPALAVTRLEAIKFPQQFEERSQRLMTNSPKAANDEYTAQKAGAAGGSAMLMFDDQRSTKLSATLLTTGSFAGNGQ